MKGIMKNKNAILIAVLVLVFTTAFSQTALKQYKAGHTFDVSLPVYFSQTSGLNSSSAIQYKNSVKDVYGFVIFDTKEELSLAEMNYASIEEFYEDFTTDFVKDMKNQMLSKPRFQKIDGTSFAEADLTYFDDEAQIEIYYLVGIVETKKSFYKVLSWTAATSKDKFKADFQKILYSLKD